MPLNATDLASEIEAALGAPGPTTEITGIADAIVSFMTSGVVNFTGTIAGTTPDGSDATGAGGVAVLPTGSLVTSYTSLFPPTPQVIAKATAIETHLSAGVFELGPGDITGACAGGTWTGGAVGGSVSGYDGSILAPLIVTAVQAPGMTPEIQNLADAICNYITDNILLTFAPPTITGPCGAPPSPPTGPAGASGLGGTIS